MSGAIEHLPSSGDHAAAVLDATAPANDSAWAAPVGRRALIAGAAGMAAATAIGASAQAAAVPSGASYYEPLDAVRLVDTRTYGSYRNTAKGGWTRPATNTVRINLRSNPYISLPADAVAVVVSVAGIYNGQRGWIAAVPTGSTDLVSNINMSDGDNAVANMATVRIGSGGQIDIKTHRPYDFVVDILGVYRSTTVARRGGRLEFRAGGAKRALSNQRMTAGSWRTLQLSFVPASAQAVVVNLTAAQCRTRGNLTAAPVRSASTPATSNLNYGVGESRAAGAIIKLGKSGGLPSIELYSHGDAQIYVDVTGWISGDTSTESADGLFVPVNPVRIMDTRRAADFAATGKKRLWRSWSRAFELPNSSNGFGPRSNMAGVALNATVVEAMGRGFLTVLPARTLRGDVSNLNSSRTGHTVANHVISRVSTKGVEYFAHCGGDVLADVAGWYTGPPQTATYSSNTYDPPAQVAPFNWVLNVSRMGLNNWVIPNLVSGDPVVDTGNTWHWTNTGLLGNDGASIVVFGHRRSHGGPYEDQHFLVPGDRLILTTPDQRKYTYQFIKEAITNSSATNILNAARTNSAGTTISLVSCTGTATDPNRLPRGGVTYRMVSTFRLIGAFEDTRPHVG